MRDIIKDKEQVIQVKENQKGTLKQKIEINNADRENEIQALREQLNAQHELMDKQQRHMNELQVNCERVEEDLIRANRYLDKKKTQKKQINLQYQEIDQSTVTLKNKYGSLEEQMNIMIQQASPLKKINEDDSNEKKDLNAWGRPVSPGKKIRSINAMFSAESGYEALK